MILELLHMLSCFALAGAAIYWRVRKHAAEGAHKFLFPFIMAATVAGALLVIFYGWELFIAYYSGSYYVVGSSINGFSIDFRWLCLLGFTLVMLPGLGLFPPVGKRWLLVAVLALLAMVPSLLAISVRE